MTELPRAVTACSQKEAPAERVVRRGHPFHAVRGDTVNPATRPIRATDGTKASTTVPAVRPEPRQDLLDAGERLRREPGVRGSSELPYRSVVLRLHGRTLSDLLLALEGTSPRTSPGPGGQIAAPMTPELVDAVTRWADDRHRHAVARRQEVLWRVRRRGRRAGQAGRRAVGTGR